MASGKIIYRVLIAGANDRTFDSLRELLPPDSYEPPLRAGSAGEAKRMLLETDVDLVILNAPLRDEFGTQLALNLAQDNLCVLMLVPAESFDAVCYKVEDEGILTLSKPVSRSGLLGAIKLLTAMRGKLRKLDRQNQALQEKNAGHSHRKPGQVAADRNQADDRERGPLLHRKAGHGYASVPPGGGGEHHPDL